jgi:AcrR family transcriptional regulator
VSTAANSTRARRTRTLLLDAAVQAFAERGFHGTSTRTIADAAGLSSAALYVHHGSKEELLFEISKAGHEETLSIVRDASASSDDPVTQLRALVRGYALFHARKHTMARVINYEMAALSPAHRTEISGIRREIDHVMRDVIKRGVAARAFRTPDPHMTAVALESMGIDIARWYHDHGTWTAEQIADGYVEMAMRLVGVA